MSKKKKKRLKLFYPVYFSLLILAAAAVWYGCGRLQPYLADGGAFITLNAVYLGGEKGLLQLLRAAGYRVRPVNRGRQMTNNIN